jgi:murein DD-endopeptidase MepM/ murein hydrolase activator NlpD
VIIKPPLRTSDPHGAGHFGAPRGKKKNGKKKTHRGVDVACCAGSIIPSLTPGTVTKIGYPYDPGSVTKGHLRYVEVTLDGNRYRYFYVMPSVRVGDKIKQGDQVGVTQGLTKIYKGITDHFHFEHIDPKGKYQDPTNMVMNDT